MLACNILEAGQYSIVCKLTTGAAMPPARNGQGAFVTFSLQPREDVKTA